MKVLGRGERSYICVITDAEASALLASGPFDEGTLTPGKSYDILDRLSQTLAYEKDRHSIPRAVDLLRRMASELEGAFGPKKTDKV